MHLLLLALIFLVSSPSAAETAAFLPEQTSVHWTLNTRLHLVHGTFRLKEGAISFDPATGKASGQIVIDAASGESGNSSRDARMHSLVLESKQFPQIVFRPNSFTGKMPANGTASLTVHGSFDVHGSAHEFTLPVEVTSASSGLTLKSRFEIPYVAWGLKNPGNFMLKVDEKVGIEITATAKISP